MEYVRRQGFSDIMMIYWCFLGKLVSDMNVFVRKTYE